MKSVLPGGRNPHRALWRGHTGDRVPKAAKTALLSSPRYPVPNLPLWHMLLHRDPGQVGAPLPAEPVCASGPTEKGRLDLPSGPSPSASCPTPWVRAKSGCRSLGHCNRYQGQGGPHGCLPAACPQRGFKGRWRRLGRENVLGKGLSVVGSPKNSPDKAQRMGTCLVPGQDEAGEPQCVLGPSQT